MDIIMFKKIGPSLLLLGFLMTNRCHAMQMAAPQPAQPVKTLYETAAKELIRQLLRKKYTDIAKEVSKFSEDQKEFIRDLVVKSHSAFRPHVQLQQVLSGHTSTIKAVVFSPDGRFALTGSCDTTARLWDLTQSPITSQELRGHTGYVWSVAFSPNGRFALTGSRDGSARLWDLTKAPITSQQLSGYTDGILSVAFSHTGDFALTVKDNQTIRLWNITQTPFTSQQLTAPMDWVGSVGTFSPDGRSAVTGSGATTARLWDLTKTPIKSQVLQGHTRLITSVAFSPDGRFVLTGSEDATARLWNLTTSPITSQELRGHTNFVAELIFSPDSRFALTCSRDHTARLWDLSKSPITSQLLQGHTDWVESAAFSPNGRFALTGSDDKTARLWDLSKSPITSRVLRGHTGFARLVAFSADGRFASSVLQNSIYLWKIEPVNSAALTVEEVMLIAKLYENEASINDDPPARDRLQSIVKRSQLHQPTIKQITHYLYGNKQPEQECCFCSEKYDPQATMCLALPCCPRLICKICLDRLGGMSHFEPFHQKQCPFCVKRMPFFPY